MRTVRVTNHNRDSYNTLQYNTLSKAYIKRYNNTIKSVFSDPFIRRINSLFAICSFVSQYSDFGCCYSYLADLSTFFNPSDKISQNCRVVFGNIFIYISYKVLGKRTFIIYIMLLVGCYFTLNVFIHT